jgi:hypothetical protein
MMRTPDDIGSIRDFKSLVKYLRDTLDWPLDLEEIEDLTFEYEPEELGLKPDHAVKVKEVKQLRPVIDNQPWGIFWVEFENRALPVTVMRQILRALVYKKRASAKAADRKTWHLKDLMFISSLGEKGRRRINFCYFRETGEGEPILQTFFWDEQETQYYWLDRNHLQRLRWPGNTGDVDGWRGQWASAFTAGYRELIRTAKDLSEQLAALAADTRAAVVDALQYERSDGPLHRLFESFQKVLIHDLKEGDFADMVAQTIAYGLFSARCTGQEVRGLAHLEAMVPNTNRFLKELFAELANISGHKKGQINFDDLGLSKMVDLLKNTNIEAVLEDFGRQAGGGKEDPVIHFYETFLHVYNREQKVQRGVFYTPKPVVSFIVRSVHEILQKEFDLTDGLADTTTWGEMAARNSDLRIPSGVKPDAPFVQILDPATGTGTFLEEAIDVVHKTMTAKWRKQGKNDTEQHDAWNEYVSNHLLPRLHGFELMMAPYSVAHMKLGLKLRQTGYEFRSNQQLRLYLTNTLEPPEKGNRKLGFLPDFLSHETMQADEVKSRKPITVLIGNPPYSVVSLNNNPWIASLLNIYKEPVRAERNLQPLSDDYIKFLRYAHFRIEQVGYGVIGYITNHTYLSGVLHRGIRQQLLETFESLSVLDLHGSALLGLHSIDGRPDENVFDIQQGVAISVLSRAIAKSIEPKTVQHYDLWGTREHKYQALLNPQVILPSKVILTPTPPMFYFVPVAPRSQRYDAGWRIDEIFPKYSVGFVSGRDESLITFKRRDIEKLVDDLGDPEVSLTTIKDRYRIADTSGWPVAERRRAVIADRSRKSRIRKIAYRPFDYRFTFYSDFLQRARAETFRHLLEPNLALITSRLIKGENPAHAFVATAPVEKIFLSPKTSNNAYVFPLYVYNRDGDCHTRLHDGRSTRLANMSDEFEQALRTTIPDTEIRAEDVMYYVYALLNSPRYRTKYASYLKEDYPRIPLPTSVKLFLRLVDLGAALVRLHIPVDSCFDASSPHFTKDRHFSAGVHRAVWRGKSNTCEVTALPEYSRGRIYLDSEHYFDGIPQQSWDYMVGGYQVGKKWLKDRKGEVLKPEDIEEYTRIATSIASSVRIQVELDRAIEASDLL